MIIVALTCFLVWKHQRGNIAKRIDVLVAISVLVTGLTFITAASPPMVEIPTGPNQELRVMPPTAFPFTMQQYRNYDLDQFYYRIVIGWPDGIPIYEGVANDDQSEFIHFAHLYTAMFLGAYMVVGLMVILVIVYLLALRRPRKESFTMNTSPDNRTRMSEQ